MLEYYKHEKKIICLNEKTRPIIDTYKVAIFDFREKHVILRIESIFNIVDDSHVINTI